jgi:hypothetical protein
VSSLGKTGVGERVETVMVAREERIGTDLRETQPTVKRIPGEEVCHGL